MKMKSILTPHFISAAKHFGSRVRRHRFHSVINLQGHTPWTKFQTNRTGTNVCLQVYGFKLSRRPSLAQSLLIYHVVLMFGRSPTTSQSQFWNNTCEGETVSSIQSSMQSSNSGQKAWQILGFKSHWNWRGKASWKILDPENYIRLHSTKQELKQEITVGCIWIAYITMCYIQWWTGCLKSRGKKKQKTTSASCGTQICRKW